MPKVIISIVLVVALICGLFAGFTVLKIIEKAQAKETPVEATLPVIIAKTTIPAGTMLTAGDLSSKALVRSSIPPGAYNSTEKLLNRVTKSAIFAGEMILEYRLQDEGSHSGLSALIPKGMRAITLRVDDTSSVGGFIQPGYIVDMMCVFDLNDKSRETVSKVILQNVKVIATGEMMETLKDDEIAGGEKQSGQGKKAEEIHTVTVLVTLEEAESISLIDNVGAISLVMRNNTDDGIELTAGSRLSTIIPFSMEYVAPKPEMVESVPTNPPPAATPTLIPKHIVEVYRGKDKTQVKF